MKTVAIIASCDTKYKEVTFMRECVEKFGFRPLVIDMAIGLLPSGPVEITREQVAENVGVCWKEIAGQTKGELIVFMQNAIKAMVLKLFKEGKIDGVLSAGGVQNTTVATTAMRALPLGFPTLMATTIASGQRTFDTVVGTKDLLVMPSIADFSGLNLVTESVLSNACAALCGMVNYAGKPLKRAKKPTIGVSLMGVTNQGAVGAIQELQARGFETVGFHATGAGGMIMEHMAEEGILDAILDLTTHEVTAEYFGGGFSAGAKNRLRAVVEKGIPLLASVGGLDFIDYTVDSVPFALDNRRYNMHNGQLAHIKITPKEAEGVGKLFAERFAGASDKVGLLLPTKGMRANTKQGESLYAPEVDASLIKAIIENLPKGVAVKQIEGNLNEEAWGRQAACELVAMLEKQPAYKGEENTI